MDDISGSLNVAKSLADFLQTSGPYAVAALSILFAIYKDRQAQKDQDEKFELAMSVIPLTHGLKAMLDNAARARHQRQSRNTDSSPPGDIHG